jgi:aspartate kinase
MKVLKFGGTSVGSAVRIKELINIIGRDQSRIVVLSAVAGTTNALVDIASDFLELRHSDGLDKLNTLRLHYDDIIDGLHSDDTYKKKSQALIDYHFELIRGFSNDLVTVVEEKIILAQGELISTGLFYHYLQEINVASKMISALDFMKIDEDNEPDLKFISSKLQSLIDVGDEPIIYITQGFICKNAFGDIDNLRRGGSDYTASLVGAAIGADEIQIWTDIDGMHNNDPRIVKGTTPISHLSFQEAAELAYFGAKILHPQSILPAQKYKIPVRLLNTIQPYAHGTLISDMVDDRGAIRAIAAKDYITAIHIHSSRMLMAYGFLRRVFEVFERYKTPIDMITTSEVAVSITIDNTTYLHEIVEDLNSFGRVDIDEAQTIVCVVGNFNRNTHGYAARILDAVKHLPVRMISYGGSDHNVSFLLDTCHKVEALRSLQSRLF